MPSSEGPLYLSEARVQEIAERAATKAVLDTFRLLGSDITELDDINNLRDDFRYMRRQRSIAEFRKSEASKSALATLTGGVIGMLLSAITWLVSTFLRP